MKYQSWSISLSSSGVTPSASSPGVGIWVVALSLSHQKKKEKNYNGKRKYNKKLEKIYKSIKKIQVQEQWNFSLSSSGVIPSASSPGVDI
jgi:predicted RNA-binding protein YlxR (DUF448 family)